MTLQLRAVLQIICQAIVNTWRTELYAGSFGLPPCLSIVRKQQGWGGHAHRMPACLSLGAALSISSDRDLGAVCPQQMSLSAAFDQDHRPSNKQDWRPVHVFFFWVWSIKKGKAAYFSHACMYSCITRSVALDEVAGLEKVTCCQTNQLNNELKRKKALRIVTFAGVGNLCLHLDGKQNSSVCLALHNARWIFIS